MIRKNWGLLSASLILLILVNGVSAAVAADDDTLIDAENALFGSRLGLGPEDVIETEPVPRRILARVDRVTATRVTNAVWGIEDTLDSLFDRWRELEGWDANLTQDLNEELELLVAFQDFLEELEAQMSRELDVPPAGPDRATLNIKPAVLIAAHAEVERHIAAIQFAIETENCEELLLNRDHWQAINELWAELEPQLQPEGLMHSASDGD